MNEYSDVLIENDKFLCPFLLAASFQGLIKFLGSSSVNGVLYWQFTPKDKAQALIDQFRTKTEPDIPSQDLFTAIETFWKQVAKTRNGGMKGYGGTKT